jgi:hypothetical protein
MNKPLSKCDFCSYRTASGCMVTPNSYYCKKATDEYYQYIRGGRQSKSTRSLRPWDKR